MPSSTRKHANSCWTSSATPPITGRIERYRSGVSILFCSPFCTHQPSRTGERGSRRNSGRCPGGSDRKRREDAHRQIGGRVATGAAHEQPVQCGLLADSCLTLKTLHVLSVV